MSKSDFVGKQAILERKASGVDRLMLQFLLNDPSKMIYHHEPIMRGKEIVGYLTSGNYGHYLGSGVGLGYVACKGLTKEKILNFDYFIDVAGEVTPVKASIKPFYDPKSHRVRA